MRKSKRTSATPEDKTKAPEKPLRRIITKDTTTESKHWLTKEMVLETSDVKNNNTNKKRKLIKYELYREYNEVDRLCSTENLDKINEDKKAQKSENGKNNYSEKTSYHSKVETIHLPNKTNNNISIFNIAPKENDKKDYQNADTEDFLTAKYFKELNSDENSDFGKVQLRPKSTFSSNNNYDNDIARIIHELVLNKYDKKIKDHKRRSLRRQKQQKELSSWSLHKSTG